MLFCIKNAENYYFDQRLGCAAPKAGQNMQHPDQQQNQLWPVEPFNEHFQNKMQKLTTKIKRELQRWIGHDSIQFKGVLFRLLLSHTS